MPEATTGERGQITLQSEQEEFLQQSFLTRDRVVNFTDTDITNWAAFLSDLQWHAIDRPNVPDSVISPKDRARSRAEAQTFNHWANFLRELRGAVRGESAVSRKVTDQEAQKLLELFRFTPSLPRELQDVLADEKINKIQAATMDNDETAERAVAYAERYMAAEKQQRAQPESMPGTDEALRAGMGAEKAAEQEVTAATALHDQRVHQLEALRSYARGEAVQAENNPLGGVDLAKWEPDLGSGPN